MQLFQVQEGTINWMFGYNFNTRWFKYDRDYLCVNKSQFVPVIFEPPCNMVCHAQIISLGVPTP
jgi:hypothetical protein